MPFSIVIIGVGNEDFTELKDQLGGDKEHLIDKNGEHYFIPNYCINDPYFERQLDKKENCEEQNIQINITARS